MIYSRIMAPSKMFICCLVLFFIPGGFLYALVNINTADVSELGTLSGIGESKAEAIIEYRQANGSFVSTEEIKNVSGIGDVTYEKIKNDITVGENVDEDPVSEEDTSEVESKKEEDTSGEKKGIPKVSVYADIQASVTKAVVGMSIRFEGFEDAARQESKPSYQWNFGDGNTGRGSVITHIYQQPGTYVVSLRTKRYDKEEKDYIKITVSKPALSISSVTYGPNGFVEISNATDVRVDVSGWSVRTPVDRFLFPRGSYIASKSTFRIANGVLGLVAMEQVRLFDLEGREVSIYPGTVEVVPESFYQKKVTSKTSSASINKDTESGEVPDSTQNTTASVGLSTGAPDEDSGMWLWVSALLAMIIVASGVLFIAPRKRKADNLSAHDIEIIE